MTPCAITCKQDVVIAAGILEGILEYAGLLLPIRLLSTIIVKVLIIKYRHALELNGTIFFLCIVYLYTFVG